MEAALAGAPAKDAKEIMAGVERLHNLLEASRKPLSSPELASLVDFCLDLFKDSNFKVSQGALQCLASPPPPFCPATTSSSTSTPSFLPPSSGWATGNSQFATPLATFCSLYGGGVYHSLGENLHVPRPPHRFHHQRSLWREQVLMLGLTKVGEFGKSMHEPSHQQLVFLHPLIKLHLQRAILPPILQMLNDSNHGMREAAISCIEEMYAQVGFQFRDELQRHHLPALAVTTCWQALPRGTDGPVTIIFACTFRGIWKPKCRCPQAPSLLGKHFLPHLEGLNSTQLRLVTIYANRISQARTGTAIVANHA